MLRAIKNLIVCTPCFLAMAIGVSSCTRPAILPADKLTSYIQDPSNGVAKEKKINDIAFKAYYQPSDFLVLQELNSQGKKDSVTLAAIKQKYAPYRYFKLDISKNNKEVIRELGGQARYSEMLSVLAFNMNQYIDIITANKDTIKMVDYAFQQTYGMGSANSLMVVFPTDKLKDLEKYTLNIYECGFQTGDIRFEFTEKDIKKVPALELSF